MSLRSSALDFGFHEKAVVNHFTAQSRHHRCIDGIGDMLDKLHQRLAALRRRANSSTLWASSITFRANSLSAAVCCCSLAFRSLCTPSPARGPASFIWVIASIVGRIEVLACFSRSVAALTTCFDIRAVRRDVLCLLLEGSRRYMPAMLLASFSSGRRKDHLQVRYLMFV
jgi:hypothetical protein